MQEGGLAPAPGASGTAEFAAVTWERLARPVEELPRGAIAFATRTVVLKTVGSLELKLHFDEPANRAFSRAALVWLHGGGFVGGNPDSCRLQTSYFASRGLLCVRPQYRLVAQGGQVDATLADVADSLAWLRAHAAELTVTDAIARLNGVRLIGLGEPTLALWRLPDSYVAAQQEILGVLPPLPAPKLSLKKPVKRRLTQPRRGRVSPPK